MAKCTFKLEVIIIYFEKLKFYSSFYVVGNAIKRLFSASCVLENKFSFLSKSHFQMRFDSVHTLLRIKNVSIFMLN